MSAKDLSIMTADEEQAIVNAWKHFPMERLFHFVSASGHGEEVSDLIKKTEPDIQDPGKAAENCSLIKSASLRPVFLVAEDELINRAYLVTILEKHSSAIFVASNGLEAVDMCQAHPEISMVFMDIKMPKMDGITATNLIKQFRPDLPVIAVTAFMRGLDKEQIMDVGFNGFLPKPVLENELVKMIRQF